MPTSLIAQLLILFVASGVLFATWKGGVAERLAAAVVVANMVVGILVAEFLPDLEGTIRFANDGLAAVALLAVTLRYGAPWMGGVMLFYAAQFSLHSYYLVTSRPDNDRLHAIVNNVNFSGIVWCLIIGTAVAWARRARRAKARAAAVATTAQEPAA
ncbi:hypothetical protein [Phenylobacterium sp.]|uniref:hypothetical protein n=1 Tax=Phenylobacterium sp. TaxID=1871053 RepID=UPI0025E2C554|nr:hypothetical protein [Phenylobacterium sp.]MBX3482068.1 hypothetical protein [Phenylobacterium sp.]